MKYAIILGNLGNTCDRFLSSGYKDQPSKEQMLKKAAEIEGVEGVELVGTWDIAEDNVDEIGELLSKYDLQCVSIIPDHFAQKRCGKGAFTAKDNDNYRSWDDDMIVGSIHLAEYVELLFWLKEVGYEGWYSMDQYPYREEAQGALRESIEFLKAIERILDEKSMEEIRALLKEGNAVKSTGWLRKRIFG